MIGSFWHNWGTGNRRHELEKNRNRSRFLKLEQLEGRELMAADVALISDINNFAAADGLSSNPGSLTEVNGSIFFFATTQGTGTELWISDGSETGTRLVKDIYSGTGNSNPAELTNVNGTLFFTANDGINGTELWKTDGTASGTVLVRDIYAGTSSSGPAYLKSVNGLLVFRANDGNNGTELWVSDGSTAGTKILSDINSGAASSVPMNFTMAGGNLFFSADDGPDGRELWKTNGTPAGTQLIADINPGTGSSNPSQIYNLNGSVIFTANDGLEGNELWKSDGTTTGTTLISDLVSGAGSPNISVVGVADNRLLFVATSISTTLLYESDGTQEGTKVISTSYYLRTPGASGTSVNGDFYFGGVYYNNSSYNYLYKYSGGQIVDIDSFYTGASNVTMDNFTNANGTLYYSAYSSSSGYSLWKFDGTNYSVVKDISPNTGSSGRVMNMMNVGGTLFFTADDGSHGVELWKSDGTSGGTVLVKDIHHQNLGSNPTNFANIGNTLFFTASDGMHGNELWTSDGTAGGTSLVRDIRPGATSSFPTTAGTTPIVGVNGVAYFSVNDGVNGYELWRSDGTAGGTTLLRDIRAGLASSKPQNLTNVNGTLYFTANDGINGYELWKSDGTGAGTTLVRDVKTGVAGSNPKNLIAVGNTLYFIADDGTNGLELWKSDGTTSGTVLVKDINAGAVSSNASDLTPVGNKLFFVATNGANGYELWRSDGSGAGTVLVKDIYAGSVGSSLKALTNVNGTLYFGASDGRGGLWKSDGSATGTVLVQQLTGTEQITSRMVVNGGSFYFGTPTSLYKSDGTSAGTSVIKPITSPLPLTYFDGNLYYTSQGALGRSNDTAIGTNTISVLQSNNITSTGNIGVAGGNLFFSGSTVGVGNELFRLNNVKAPTTTVTRNSAGNVEVHDAGEKNDFITISRSGANVVIADGSTDVYGVISAVGVTGAVISPNGKTISIPITTIQNTGKPLLFTMSSGDDVVRIDTNNSFSSSFNPIPTTGLTLGGGDQSDKLVFINTAVNNTWTITGAQSGNVAVGKFGNITFNGMEFLQGGAGVDTFRLTNTGSNALVNLDGGPNAKTDGIELTRDSNITLTDVSLNIQPLNATLPIQSFTLTNIKRGTLTGGNGDNFFDANLFTGSLKLVGGNGNDTLWGGYANDVVDGGAGNDFVGGGPGDDILLGGAGRDVLIGGAGIDKLDNSNTAVGDDLLIGGRTTYGFQKALVPALMNAWASNATYDNRIALLSVTGVGSNKQFKFNATTVLDDSAVDILYGGDGNDWFFSKKTGTYADTHDATATELAKLVALT